MASIETLVASPAKVLQAGNSGAGAQLVLTQTAGARTKTYVTGITISASAAPATPVAATLVIGGVTMTFQIPAAAYAPFEIPFTRPLESNFGESVVLTVPAHGGAVIVSAAILGYPAST